MKGDKVSIIIPVYNEEKQIPKIIGLLKRTQAYPFIEIIMVVNNSTDKSFELAKKYADKALNFPSLSGVSAARNEGALKAKGDVFIFTDADTYFSEGAVGKMVEAADLNTLGTCLGKGDNNSFKGKLFFFYKNWFHRLRIYKGVVDGVLFCHRNVFFKTKGFDEKKKIAEFQDFIKRARKSGAKYKFLSNCFAVVSLRRYEEKGYLNTHFFWIKWRIKSFFGKGKETAGEYFEPDKTKP